MLGTYVNIDPLTKQTCNWIDLGCV